MDKFLWLNGITFLYNKIDRIYRLLVPKPAPHNDYLCLATWLELSFKAYRSADYPFQAGMNKTKGFSSLNFAYTYTTYA